jgi:hypothetical protein
MTRNKTVAPKPAPAKPKRVKKAKPELRSLEHKHFGPCKVLGTFIGDTANFVDVDFSGVKRTLSLGQTYWTSDISELLAVMPPQPRSVKPESKSKKPAEPADDEPEESGDAAELEFKGGHLLAETEGEIEEDGEVDEEVESAEPVGVE